MADDGEPGDKNPARAKDTNATCNLIWRTRRVIQYCTTCQLRFAETKKWRRRQVLDMGVLCKKGSYRIRSPWRPVLHCWGGRSSSRRRPACVFYWHMASLNRRWYMSGPRSPRSRSRLPPPDPDRVPHFCMYGNAIGVGGVEKSPAIISISDLLMFCKFVNSFIYSLM
jgi:hypothetical protein